MSRYLQSYHYTYRRYIQEKHYARFGVGHIVEEILNADVKCVKVTGAQNKG